MLWKSAAAGRARRDDLQLRMHVLRSLRVVPAHQRCPNCGGGFQLRPIRPKAMLEQRPASTDVHPAGVNEQAHRAFIDRYSAIPPFER
jgi:hypothetical protein